MVDPEERDDGGMTALMWAAANDNVDAIQALAPVSDFNARDKDGRRALDYARRKHASASSSVADLVIALELVQNERAQLRADSAAPWPAQEGSATRPRL